MAKFKKKYEDSILPLRGTKNSAGYDVYSHENTIIPAHDRKLVKIGIYCEMDSNQFLAVVPRSGLALKQGITVLNAPGIVDSDFSPNEIGVILYNSTDTNFEVKVGDRIAQVILQHYEVVENDNVKNEERTAGFGSTGV